MKEKIDFSVVPFEYQMCLNPKCPKATTCLRQLAEQSAPEDLKYWCIVSPRHLATLKGECPYYRSNTKVRYAKGFIEILDNLSRKQMQGIVPYLMGAFGRRTYYRVRKGERLLSPSEQQVILNILKKHGVKGTQEFDAYIDDYDW
ncbi:DUF6078 family protein [Bacteroides sp.]|uniref:DUF6078 family protein n=1 Tax=Bacteroides sp. TaxID=29523 RepID=UPI0026024BEB|nr:DUF6078 family protein [Bacteroides sp.]MDD3039182.1 DUF6078 family protein [Bacteroides sp.]